MKHTVVRRIALLGCAFSMVSFASWCAWLDVPFGGGFGESKCSIREYWPDGNEPVRMCTGWPCNSSCGGINLAPGTVLDPSAKKAWIDFDGALAWHGWKPMPGVAHQVAANAGFVYAVGITQGVKDFPLFMWNGAQWAQLPGAVVRMSVDTRGIPWVINSSGSVFYWESSKGWVLYWQSPTPVSGTVDIAVSQGPIVGVWVLVNGAVRELTRNLSVAVRTGAPTRLGAAAQGVYITTSSNVVENPEGPLPTWCTREPTPQSSIPDLNADGKGPLVTDLIPLNTSSPILALLTPTPNPNRWVCSSISGGLAMVDYPSVNPAETALLTQSGYLAPFGFTQGDQGGIGDPFAPAIRYSRTETMKDANLSTLGVFAVLSNGTMLFKSTAAKGALPPAPPQAPVAGCAPTTLTAGENAQASMAVRLPPAQAGGQLIIPAGSYSRYVFPLCHRLAWKALVAGCVQTAPNAFSWQLPTAGAVSSDNLCLPDSTSAYTVVSNK